MKHIAIGAIAILLSFAQASLAAEATGLEFSLKCLREQYHLNEPVAAVLLVKNITSNDIKIDFAYPMIMGLSFKENEGVLRVRSLDGLFVNRRITYLSIPAKSSRTWTFALNEYIDNFVLGTYNIDYTIHVESLRTAAKNKLEYTQNSYGAKGSLVVKIVDGAMDKVWTKELIGAINPLAPTDIAPRTKNLSVLANEEITNLLLWFEPSFVADQLIVFGKANPGVSEEIINILHKYFSGRRGVKRGIWEIGAVSTPAAYQAALAIYELQSLAIQPEWVEEVLKSQNSEKKLLTLTHYTIYGRVNDIPRIMPLSTDDDPVLAAAAVEAIKAMRERPPLDDKH